MCLYTRNIKPKVAKRDIMVLKCLREMSDGSFKSPSQSIQITLNEMMIAKPNKPQLAEYCTDDFGFKVSTLNGGAIHAKLYGEPDYGNTQRVAVIPEGTEYWLDSFGKEIAATKMLITDKKAENYKHDKQLALEILEDAPKVKGIRVADYMLSDGSFIHPDKAEEVNQEAIVGRVVGFKNKKPMVAALTTITSVAWDRSYDSHIGEYYGNMTEALEKDTDGIAKIREYKKNREERFEAFNACLDYRKDKNEEWYMPTLKDMTTLLNNTIYLNAACVVSGIGDMIDYERWYWTCSEGSYGHSWYCYLRGEEVRCCWDDKDCRHRIVPFLASLTENNK